jgi:hypothetical protein
MSGVPATPPRLSVQLISEGGGVKDVFITVQLRGKNTLYLDVSAQSTTGFKQVHSFLLSRAFSELSVQENQGAILTLKTEQKSAVFAFQKLADAQSYHQFICDKSEIVAENNILDDLDDQMRRNWPFPPGCFF